MKTLTTSLLLILTLAGRCEAGSSKVSEVVLQTIAMEAANQSAEGQYLVASVIVNRARASGKSLVQVCLAPKQFSAWNSRSWASSWIKRHYTASVRIQALNALQRALNSPFKGIRHYHTDDVSPYWAKGHKAAIIEGSHAFYEGIR